MWSLGEFCRIWENVGVFDGKSILSEARRLHLVHVLHLGYFVYRHETECLNQHIVCRN